MDRPILFSAPMVRALIEGRKTQTRRILKPQPHAGHEVWCDDDSGEWFQVNRFGDQSLRVNFFRGGRLWVRETLCIHNNFGKPLAFGPQIREGDNARIWSYAADEIEPETVSRRIPAIHMPRTYSRITDTITDVSLQRLQEIDEEDAIAEGIYRLDRRAWLDDSKPLYGLRESSGHDTAVGAFNHLWRDINGDGSWAANPWVAAITFTVENRNIDACPAIG